MKNGTLRNCTYRYSSHDSITSIALWIDGPCTCVAAILALIGVHYAVRFLFRAGLNKDLTAALFSLCVIDSLLMMTVFLFYCIEAIGVLFFSTNLMYNRQLFTSSLHGVAQSLTTASTMLVIYITFLRFMVVMRPLRYATSQHSKRTNRASLKQRKASMITEVESSAAGTQKNRSSLKTNKEQLPLRKYIRSCLLPGLVIFLCFAVNIPVYFEFTVERCFDVEHGVEASCPAPTVFRHSFTRYKAILMTLTQTIGPVATILILSVLTEYRVHRSLKKRRKLFESQQRSRSVVLTEESKEKVSRTVAIFIAVKFLIFRSMPVFFDVYENLYGIESFGVALSILVRISDFMIVLNSATNSLAYFGKKRWLEKRLRLRLLKRDEKRLEKAMRRASQGSQQTSLAGSPRDGQRTHIKVTHHRSADYSPLMYKD
ncbi:G protein-coupled receptor [Trichostrongylus colubriformis]|uniref:G protein-coupled receptor n=1 Tax=Trichostrongylus colubriformis TaxID=6319 RepID=A0AAN8ILW7_TRICO